MTFTDNDSGADAPTAQITVVDGSGAIDGVVDDMVAFMTDPDISQQAQEELEDELEDVLEELLGEDDDDDEGALYLLSQGQLSAAAEHIKNAIEALDEAEEELEDEQDIDFELDFSDWKYRLALSAKSIAVGAIEDAATVADSSKDWQKIAAAEAAVAEGDAKVAEQKYKSAASQYKKAINRVKKLLNEFV